MICLIILMKIINLSVKETNHLHHKNHSSDLFAIIDSGIAVT
jgi:hypothetical protein